MSSAVWRITQLASSDLHFLARRGRCALDRVVSEPQPGREAVVGLDLVGRGGDILAQFGFGDEAQQRDRADQRARAPGTPCSRYLLVLAQEMTI